jgi:hypothetical protein
VEKTVIGSVIIVINSTNNVLKFKTISKNCQKPRLSGPGNSTLNKVNKSPTTNKRKRNKAVHSMEGKKTERASCHSAAGPISECYPVNVARSQEKQSRANPLASLFPPPLIPPRPVSPPNRFVSRFILPALSSWRERFGIRSK